MKDIQELEDFLTNFTPMIDRVKKQLVRKWFALEPGEIGSLVNLSIYKLWRKNKHEKFILTKETLFDIAERAVIKQICKAPNVEVKRVENEDGKKVKIITLYPLLYLDAPIDEEITLLDVLSDDSLSMEEELERKEEVERKKNIVLKIITDRTYKQLCFEYENKCVSQEHLNLIQKIKREIQNELN